MIAVERQSAYAEDAPAEGDAPVSDTPPENADAPPAAASEVPPASSAPAAAAPAPNPATQSPPAPLASPTTYVVVQGDTIYSIARKHGVSVDAILWANKMTDPNVVRVGQKLIIPPATGKLHVVKDGDTLDSLSQTYGVSKAGIAVVNGLAENATLTAGQRLLIPSSLRPPATDPTFSPAQLVAASNAEPVPVSAPSGPATGSPVPPLISSIAPLIQSPGVLSPSSSTTSAVRPSGPTVSITNRTITKLAWPFTVKPPTSGVSQGFRPGHTGIDIYAPAGTSIGACAAGTVKLAEKDPPGFTGYGWIVIVDHGDGFTTWYAHLGSFAVKVDDRVETGQKIGTVGMTGRTTGPHLHLETRINTSPFDPRLALPSL